MTQKLKFGVLSLFIVRTLTNFDFKGFPCRLLKVIFKSFLYHVGKNYWRILFFLLFFVHYAHKKRIWESLCQCKYVSINGKSPQTLTVHASTESKSPESNVKNAKGGWLVRLNWSRPQSNWDISNKGKKGAQSRILSEKIGSHRKQNCLALSGLEFFFSV